MSSNFYHDEDNDNDVVFQDLMPEKPANAFQKRIIHMQRHWSSYWNTRHRFIALTVISILVVCVVVFEVIHTPAAQPEPAQTVPEFPRGHALVAVQQMVPAAQVLYIVVSNPDTNIGTLEAINTDSGRVVWTYAHHNTEEIKLSGNTLYIQTDIGLVALNATTRAPIWENRASIDFGTWQVDKDILFTSSSNSTITAFNGKTGLQLWQIYEPVSSWKVMDGIFYALLSQNLGLVVLNAHSGRKLWSDPTITQNSTDPIMTVDQGNLYVQNAKSSMMQAFVGASGKLRWQVNTYGANFIPTASHAFLFLTDVSLAQVEVIDSQTGKLLWQRQGTLAGFTESNNQTAISSLINNKTDVIRTTDGTILYHLRQAVDSLQPAENGVVLCTNHPDSTETASFHVQAIQLSNGNTVWSSQVNNLQYLPNNTVALVSDNGNALIQRRADTGETLWQDNF